MPALSIPHQTDRRHRQISSRNPAQPFGAVLSFISQLKFREEYVTMELTKSERIRAGLQRSFQSGTIAKTSTVGYGHINHI